MFVRASALAAALLVVPVWAGVTNITHPAYYSTIHDAVNAAIDGDTLLVSTGRYAPDWISMSAKRLQILGGWTHDFSAQLPVNSVVGGVSYVAGVGGGTCLLQRLTLTGVSAGFGLQGNSGAIITCSYCTITHITNHNYGAGVRALSGARIVLERTAVQYNVTTNPASAEGAGIHVSGGSVEVGDGCNIMYNSSASRGGGVYVSAGAVNVFGLTDISYNDAVEGGGVHARNGATVTIHGNADVRGNTAGSDGGGVYLAEATLLAYDSSTYVGYPYAANGRNVATNNGGNVYAVNATVIISNGAAIANGLALNYGGGAYLSTSTLVLVHNGSIGSYNGTYQTNEAERGGGVYLHASALRAESGCEVMLGRASSRGGGILADRSSLTLTGARVQHNVCNSMGGGIYLVDTCAFSATNTLLANNTANQYGGAVYVALGDAMMVHLQDCRLTNNHAAFHGGALRWYSRGALTAAACYVAYNDAGSDGGAVAVAEHTGTLHFVACDVRRNRAGRHGGAWYAEKGSLVIDQSEAQWNTADENASGSGDGGALYVSGPARAELRCEFATAFQYNQAVNGGAVYARNAATVSVATTAYPFQFAQNVARDTGGGICADNATVALGYGTTVSGNSAGYGGGIFATNGAQVVCNSTNIGMVFVTGNQARMSGGGICAISSGTVVRAYGTWIGTHLFLENAPNIAHGASTLHGGGGVAVLDGARWEAVNSRISFNVSSNRGGGLLADASAVMMESSFAGGPVPQPLTRLRNNTARYGGAVFCEDSVVSIAAADISSNRAHTAVGGVELIGGRGDVVNCLLAHNTASNAGAIAAVFSGQLTLRHCTIAQNGTNGIVTDFGGVCTLTNCIVWGNTGAQMTTGNIVRFSDVQGGYAGAGNLDADPAFVAPGLLRFDLSAASPCIDAGTVCGITHDMLGEPRPYGSAPDVGAYEFVPEPGGMAVLALLVLMSNRTYRTNRTYMEL